MADESNTISNIKNVTEEDENLSKLEELLTDALLIELLNTHKAEVFENVVFDGTKRYYIEDMTERDYSLEHVTPYQFEIFNTVFETGTWGVLIERLTAFLLEKFPEYNNSIYKFQCPWSKQSMFSDVQKTNYRTVKEGLYVNCNHTALHSCWFIQDLLDFFAIDKSSVKFLVHRPSEAEPPKVKEYIEKRFRRNFVSFMKTRYNRSEDFANKTLSYVDKYLNKILQSISRSYTNFYLFDDGTILNSYAKKVREKINANYRLSEQGKKTLNRCLDYIQEFYRS